MCIPVFSSNESCLEGIPLANLDLLADFMILDVLGETINVSLFVTPCRDSIDFRITFLCYECSFFASSYAFILLPGSKEQLFYLMLTLLSPWV